MEINLIPQVPSLRFEINNTAVGMVSSFREVMVTQPVLIQPMGSPHPTAILPGPCHYELTLTRLLLDTAAIPIPIQLRSLHSFTLKITSSSKILTFTGCEIAKLEFSSDMEQGMAEQVQIYACSRTETAKS